VQRPQPLSFILAHDVLDGLGGEVNAAERTLPDLLRKRLKLIGSQQAAGDYETLHAEQLVQIIYRQLGVLQRAKLLNRASLARRRTCPVQNLLLFIRRRRGQRDENVAQ